MLRHRIWRTSVAIGSCIIGLSYAVLSVHHGFEVPGELFHAALFLAAGIALLYHTFKRQNEGSQMPGPLTSQQIAEYECAMETIGNALAARSQAIHDERSKAEPNQEALSKLRQEQADLVIERSKISIDDVDSVRRVIANYGAQVRAQI
ncbi:MULTISPECIES: hypothetical protein [Pseudomonas syringae group]|uniref:Uncharacterized protein n=1 Tax=Pseudomonas syringae pv. coriandricola TaxID=264453 RepID=A0A3M3J903_9PSED|nr:MULTISPECIES: hypothetical protein [Pseudomonas syringae group]RMN07304.1 hypothetical protein ALQ65_200306 [Pseudomonas syringae pv. coriandricola]